jgi:exosortase D (VPLPA-CTERM-specific)
MALVFCSINTGKKMLVKAETVYAEPDALPRSTLTYLGVFIGVCLVLIAGAFYGPLRELVHRWSVQEEYSHGFLIPFIAGWLIWSRRHALLGSIGRPSFWGPVLIIIAAALRVAGELSAIFVLSQIGFVLCLMGLALGVGGRSLLKVVFIPLVLLLFAIPMPYFVDALLSFRLQLISSQMGTFFIRALGIPVFLEGNLIDLGVYKLQVVEACSGLRYLYPLMSLGFLAAYLYQAPFWQRALVFLSTIPITIVMNSFRIGMVGVLVNYWGPQDADGFLHMFEGWIIFIACSGLLILEMMFLARVFLHKNFWEVFNAPTLKPQRSGRFPTATFFSAPLISCLALLAVTGWGAATISTRQEIVPERKLFALFPNKIDAWRGRTSSLDTGTATFLGLTDYVLSDYARADVRDVNLYVAYYASQRSGLSPHSPSVCIPGNGWQIASLERTEFVDGAIRFPMNRAIIFNGTSRQVVYYWYEERGMMIANEWLSKLYLLRDAIFENRTDGALVRLISPVYPGESEADADARLHKFAMAALPRLKEFLPAATASR